LVFDPKGKGGRRKNLSSKEILMHLAESSLLILTSFYFEFRIAKCGV
jgi:hypothetical protein